MKRINENKMKNKILIACCFCCLLAIVVIIELDSFLVSKKQFLYFFWHVLYYVLYFFHELLIPFVAFFSLWVYFFIACNLIVLSKLKILTLEIMYGDIYMYFCYPDLYEVDFSFDDQREPLNIPYSNKEYKEFFVWVYLIRYLRRWTVLKGTAFVYHRSVNTSFGFMVLWHFYLFQYVPAFAVLNVIYFVLVFFRKLASLVGNIGAIVIINPLEFHKYEMSKHFSPEAIKNHSLTKLARFIPLLFGFLMVCVFIVLAAFVVYLCCFRLHDGALVILS